MPILSILIPTHRRMDYCLSLIGATLAEIKNAHLEKKVEICISENDPGESIQLKVEELQNHFSEVAVTFLTTIENIGFSKNFHKVVTMAQGEFCILIGDDDQFVPGALTRLVKLIETNVADLYISSFISKSNNDKEEILYPTRNVTQDQRIMLQNKAEFTNWFDGMRDMNGNNSGLFAFISNVVFKRKNWFYYLERRDWNTNSIYIQAFIHMKTALSGQIIQYIHDPMVIRNAKEDINIMENPSYCANIIIDMAELLFYFFHGELLTSLKKEFIPYSFYGPVIEKWSSHPLLDKIKMIPDPILRRFEKLYLKRECWDFLQDKTIVMFGCGHIGDAVWAALNKEGVKVSFFTDNNSALWGKTHCGVPVISPEKASSVPEAVFILSIASTCALTDVAEELCTSGVPLNRMFHLLPQ